jgi:hypothetical protein
VSFAIIGGKPFCSCKENRRRKKHFIECIFVTVGGSLFFLLQRRFIKRYKILQRIFQVNIKEFPFLFERILAN